MAAGVALENRSVGDAEPSSAVPVGVPVPITVDVLGITVGVYAPSGEGGGASGGGNDDDADGGAVRVTPQHRGLLAAGETHAVAEASPPASAGASNHAAGSISGDEAMQHADSDAAAVQDGAAQSL